MIKLNNKFIEMLFINTSEEWFKEWMKQADQ